MKRKSIRLTTGGFTIAAAAVLTMAVAPGSQAATASGPNCPATSGGVNHSYYTVTCTSGPGAYYAAGVICSNASSKLLVGPDARYASTSWSEIDCPSGAHVTQTYVLTR